MFQLLIGGFPNRLVRAQKGTLIYNADYIMKPIIFVAIVLTLLSSGCRTTEKLKRADSRAAKNATSDAVAEQNSGANDPFPRPQPNSKQSAIFNRVKRLSKSHNSPIQQVDFEQPIQELPAGRPDAPDRSQPPTDDPPQPHPDQPSQPLVPEVLARPGTPPTLKELEQIALANNPTLEEAQAKVAAAQGRWLQVGLYPNLVAGYSAQKLGSAGQSEQHGMLLGQEFVRGGKLKLNRAVAQQEIVQAEQDLAAQEFRVLTDLRLAYYDFLIAVRRIDLAESLLEYTKTIEDDTQKLLEGGEAKRSDLLRAQIQVRNIEIVIRDAKFQKRAAWKTLITVMGVPDFEMPDVNDSMRTDAKLILDEAAQHAIDRQGELERILNSSPELMAAMANVEAARWSVDRARAQVVPNINAFTILQYDRDVGGHDMILRLSMPIPIWNRNQGGIQEAQSQVMQAERHVDRVALKLIQRFQVVYQRYLNAKYQVDQYTKTGETDKEKGILIKAQESIDLNQQLHRVGEIKNLEMFVAQQVYTQANLAYLDAVRELWASILEIEGLLLKDSFTK